MKKLLAFVALCFVAIPAANAYDPGRASGYDRSNNNSRELFREDDSARRMQQDFKRQGNSNQYEREIERPAIDGQRDLERGFYDNQQYREEKQPRKSRVRQI